LIRKKAQWINVGVEAEVMWNYNILNNLVKKALNGSLDKAGELKLIEALKNEEMNIETMQMVKSESELIKEWGIEGNDIPVLVETYTELSYQIFHHLNNYPEVHE
jgi:hypothetical protein